MVAPEDDKSNQTFRNDINEAIIVLSNSMSSTEANKLQLNLGGINTNSKWSSHHEAVNATVGNLFESFAEDNKGNVPLLLRQPKIRRW